MDFFWLIHWWRSKPRCHLLRLHSAKGQTREVVITQWRRLCVRLCERDCDNTLFTIFRHVKASLRLSSPLVRYWSESIWSVSTISTSAFLYYTHRQYPCELLSLWTIMPTSSTNSGSYAVVGIAVGGASWYIGRLASRPDGACVTLSFFCYSEIIIFSSSYLD